MTNTTSIPDNPPSAATHAAIRRALGVIGLAAAGYIAISTNSDPLPSPAREIAGGVLIALFLAAWISRTIARMKPATARQSPLRIALGALVVALFILIIFQITWFDPLPDPFGRLIAFLALPLLLGMVVWDIRASRDEVARASFFESFSWGSLAAVFLIYMSSLAVNLFPGLADWLNAQAQLRDAPGGPAGYGFAMGAMWSMMVLWVSLFAGWALWWRGKK